MPAGPAAGGGQAGGGGGAWGGGCVSGGQGGWGGEGAGGVGFFVSPQAAGINGNMVRVCGQSLLGA